MTEAKYMKSRFFNSRENDRVYQAEDFAEYFSSFIGNGINPNAFDSKVGKKDFSGLKVSANNNMKIDISPGSCMINGYYGVIENNTSINLSPASNNGDRIDRIIVRLDSSKRYIDLQVLEGKISTNPKPLEIIRNEEYFDLVLADIKIRKSASSISNYDITDQRGNRILCGWIETLISGNFDQIKKDMDKFIDEINTNVSKYDDRIKDTENHKINAGPGISVSGDGYLKNNPTISLELNSDKMLSHGYVKIKSYGDGDDRIKWFNLPDKIGPHDLIILQSGSTFIIDRLYKVKGFLTNLSLIENDSFEEIIPNKLNWTNGYYYINYNNGNLRLGIQNKKDEPTVLSKEYKWFIFRRTI